MKIKRYFIKDSNLPKKCRFAVVCDLHAQKPDKVIELLKREKPDYILMPGDIFEPLDGRFDDKNEKTFPLLREAARIAPTFYSTGNHEDGGVHSQSSKWKKGEGIPRAYSEENIKRINDSGVHFLLDSFVFKDGIAFGGLASGLICKGQTPNLEFLRKFASIDAQKVLLCHHPEYYEKYLKDLQIDLIVSGHAHGGQWRIFSRGVYSPGQGLFPKYTSGVHDGRLVISKGLKKSWKLPRFFNPTEIVIVEI